MPGVRARHAGGRSAWIVWRLLRDIPRLVLAQTPAYAGQAPWYGGRESEGLLAAASASPGVSPPFDGVSGGAGHGFLLRVHGAWAAVCTVARWWSAGADPFGQLVSVTGVNGEMEATIMSLTVNPSRPDPPTAVGPGGRHPTYTRFQARDGKWLACGALGAKFETTLLGALGLSWVLAEERMGGRAEKEEA